MLLSLKWTKNKVSVATGQENPLPTSKKPEPASKEEKTPQQAPAHSSVEGAQTGQTGVSVSPHKPRQIKLVRMGPKEGGQPVYQETQSSASHLMREPDRREPALLTMECRNVLSELLERGKQLREAMTESMTTPRQRELQKRFHT